MGSGVVKHENFNPTNSFKVRNALAFVTTLKEAERANACRRHPRNHDSACLGGAQPLHRATLCVPLGNNPEKNAGMRG